MVVPTQAAVPVVKFHTRSAASGLPARSRTPVVPERTVATIIHEATHQLAFNSGLQVRFADNPLVVAGPRIRAYTGVPLLLDDGICLGTFCVIDIQPRDFSDTELAALRDLRDLALDEIKRVRGSRER